jgi:heat shock protein HslJ
MDLTRNYFLPLTRAECGLDHSGKIKIEKISSTKMGGSEEMLAQEHNYFQALEKVSEYQLTDEGLVLPYPSPARGLFFTRQ